MHTPTWRTPEARLLLAMLRDSINLYVTSLQKIRRKQKHIASARRNLAELEDWFTEPMHGAKAALPFITVCSSLDIDPDWLRERIFNLKTSKYLPKPSRVSEVLSPLK